MEDKDQNLLVHITQSQSPVPFYIFVAYAKCDEQLRNVLCDELKTISNRITRPWGVVGYFNVSLILKKRLEEDPAFNLYHA